MKKKESKPVRRLIKKLEDAAGNVVRVEYEKDYEEFSAICNGYEPGRYFAGDKDDALETASIMLKQANLHKPKSQRNPAPGAPGRKAKKKAPTKNPKGNPEAVAEKKARAWFGSDALMTKAQEIDWTPPESAVHIGQFIAIEYLSDKFDGVKRIYRHDVVSVRQMLLSPDGSTIIVDPPFKVTKRGIEG
jgi:hypothetical protein